MYVPIILHPNAPLALVHQSFYIVCVLSPSRRWFYSRVGSFRALPSEVAVSAGRCDAGHDGGSDWQHQSGVGVSIIKVRKNEQSYVPGVMIVS